MATGSDSEIHGESATKAPQDERQSLRRSLIERRLALSGDDCARLSAALRNHLEKGFPQLAGMRVAFCWPVNNEPDLRPLLEAWLATQKNGFCALLPVVVGESAALAFRPWTPDTALIADRYGIPTPAAGDFVEPEALLLPLNAFDAAGYRIGYGGGYFDRTLAILREQATPPLAIGVGFELARVDSIHPAAHDQPLDAVVTEAGVFRLQSAK
ncbi:MAG: 5-formyltetrahydrofolate cyclo-ligase [Rhodocyclaceae bacterium]